MQEIIIGTTPTIVYNFQTVSVSDISTAILTIKYKGNIVIEKELLDAEVGTASLSWTLTQSDTLSFSAGQRAKMMLNFKLVDGTRGASDEMELVFKTNHITEVI